MKILHFMNECCGGEHVNVNRDISFFFFETWGILHVMFLVERSIMHAISKYY